MKITSIKMFGLQIVGHSIELLDDDSGATFSVHVKDIYNDTTVRDVVTITGTGKELRSLAKSFSSGLKKRTKIKP